MGIIEDFSDDLRKRGCTNEQIKDYLSLIKYVYIGQNIRNEGILKTDKRFKEKKTTC